MIQFDEHIFSDGLVQPPARNGLSEKTIILIGIYFIINFRELDRDQLNYPMFAVMKLDANAWSFLTDFSEKMVHCLGLVI